MSYKYNARISCSSKDGGVTYKLEGFKFIENATKWIAEEFAYFMKNWASIDENGIIVVGEVFDENEEEFSDMYELKCGI